MQRQSEKAGFAPHRRLTAIAARLMAGLLLAVPGVADAAARGHRDSGYGLAGGLSPDLALGNVYSGIYGLAYTYDRANYDFNCRPAPTLVDPDHAALTVRPCSAVNRPQPY